MNPEVVIVGAGIAGAAAAQALVAEGVRVVLVDANLAGSASLAGAGIVSTVAASPAPDAWLSTLFSGVAHYRTLCESLEISDPAAMGFHQVGTLITCPPEDGAALEVIRRRAIALGAKYGDSDVGVPESVDEHELRMRMPLLADDMIGLLLPQAARLDARVLRGVLLEAVVRGGAQIERGRAVLVIERGRVAGVRVEGHLIPAQVVIDATGAWSARLPVTALKGQLVHLRLRGTETARLPIVQSLAGNYILGFPRGRIVVGATREPAAEDDPRPTAAGLLRVLADALPLAPGLADAEFLEQRAGFRPVSPDGIPIVGSDPEVAGLVHVGGLGTWGLATGPYLGRLAAYVALGEQLPASAAILDPGRLVDVIEVQRERSGAA